MLYYLKKIRNYTFKEIILKSKIRLNYRMRFSKDLFGPTYSNKKIKLEFSCIGSLIHLPYTPDNVEYISNLYVTHYFDLLGSGWVQVKKGMDCLGLEGYRYEDLTVNGYEGNMINRANRRESEAIRILIDKKYIPIDWQLDFKSGYRWSEKTWYMEIKYGHKPGVDIKVPWELARMQHLPILAWTYGFIAEDKEKYAREFRNQILDFVVENPPDLALIGVAPWM